LLALSGIIMIPLRRVSAWEQRRDEAKRRRLSSKDNRTPAELEPLNASGKETNAAK
uniref:Branched-chain amino acid ABC transporter permease n=1 Tax=Anisakis simplex TaxID=6269 RepID=A0A0M3JJS0_ANISI